MEYIVLPGIIIGLIVLFLALTSDNPETIYIEDDEEENLGI